MSCCCVLDVLARDADAIVAGNLGNHMKRKLPNDPNVYERDVMHVLVNEDYGGESGKFSIGYLDVDKPCGDKHRAIVCSYEALKPEDPKPVSNGYAAFKAAKDEGFDNNSVIDESFGVRVLREAFNQFGISVQRYWNGAVSLSLP